MCIVPHLKSVYSGLCINCLLSIFFVSVCRVFFLFCHFLFRYVLIFILREAYEKGGTEVEQAHKLENFESQGMSTKPGI